MEACLINMEKEALDRLVKLFHTVYYLTLADRPFRDFVGVCSLQERNGVNTGKSCMNDIYIYIYIYLHLCIILLKL